MATNFYTGLASGLDKANEIQRQDEAERMARDRAQALEIQRDVENQRANERMGMERERITRANALSDFQLTEAQRKSAEEIEIKDGFKKIHEQIYAPKKVMGPDGAEVDITPDPKDPKLASEYTAAMTQHMAKFGLLKPADRKVLMETDRWVQQTGLEDSFRELIATRGLSAASRAAVAPKLGLDPNAPVSLEVDDSGPFKRTFVLGTSADGKPFKQEATWIAAALGMRDADPDAPGRKTALDVARMKELEERAGYYRDRGDLAGRTDPNLRRGPATEDPDAPLPVKVQRAEINKIPRLAAEAAKKFNPALGTFAQTKSDADKEKFLTQVAIDAVRSGRAVDAPSAVDAASQRWDAIEQSVLSGAGQFVFDKQTKKFRPAKEGEKGMGLNGVMETDRLRLRNEMINAEIARRKAEYERRQRPQQ